MCCSAKCINFTIILVYFNLFLCVICANRNMMGVNFSNIKSFILYGFYSFLSLNQFYGVYAWHDSTRICRLCGVDWFKFQFYFHSVFFSLSHRSISLKYIISLITQIPSPSFTSIKLMRLADAISASTMHLRSHSANLSIYCWCCCSFAFSCCSLVFH